MPKIIRILRSCSMKIFCTVNISKLNFWLLICIAKNFIWTTLKKIFLHPQISDFQILSYHYKPYINGNIIYSAFRWCINLNFEKLILMTGFVLQGYILLVIFKSLLLIKTSINTVITVYDILQFKITVFYYDILKNVFYSCNQSWIFGITHCSSLQSHFFLLSILKKLKGTAFIRNRNPFETLYVSLLSRLINLIF